MPSKGKAAVILIWVQTGLAALAALLGMIGLSRVDAEVDPEAVGLVVLALGWAVVVGGFVFAMSFLLIKAKNWARIVLIVFYSILVAILPVSIILGDVSGSDFRNFLFGIIMLWLLTSHPVRDWCNYVEANTGNDPFADQLRAMRARTGNGASE
ncbi:hypothetical protein GCM10029992_65640 [Glycomyces albus]